MANKFLNQEGVGILWERINAKFAEKAALESIQKTLQEHDSKIDNLEAGTYDDSELRDLISANASAIEVLNGDGEGSAAKIAAAEVAKVVAGADASFDTLKEIADWIANDTTGAAGMANDIATLQEVIGNKVDAAAVTSAIEEALKVEGVDKYALASALNSLVERVAELEKIGGLTQSEIEEVTPLA